MPFPSLPVSPFCPFVTVKAVEVPSVNLSLLGDMLKGFKKRGRTLRRTDAVELTSAKTNKITDILAKHLLMDKKLKAVLFSSFTDHLDILEMHLRGKNWHTVRVDGSHSSNERTELLNEFRTARDPVVLLISVKVGGVAINLVESNLVIMCDPWWNPAIDMQAVERLYRIGQKREVFAYRIFARESIEDRMIELQNIKLGFHSFALDKGFAKTNFNSLLKNLFKIKNHNRHIEYSEYSSDDDEM